MWGQLCGMYNFSLIYFVKMWPTFYFWTGLTPEQSCRLDRSITPLCLHSCHLTGLQRAAWSLQPFLLTAYSEHWLLRKAPQMFLRKTFLLPEQMHRGCSNKLTGVRQRWQKPCVYLRVQFLHLAQPAPAPYQEGGAKASEQSNWTL